MKNGDAGLAGKFSDRILESWDVSSFFLDSIPSLLNVTAQSFSQLVRQPLTARLFVCWLFWHAINVQPIYPARLICGDDYLAISLVGQIPSKPPSVWGRKGLSYLSSQIQQFTIKLANKSGNHIGEQLLLVNQSPLSQPYSCELVHAQGSRTAEEGFCIFSELYRQPCVCVCVTEKEREEEHTTYIAQCIHTVEHVHVCICVYFGPPICLECFWVRAGPRLIMVLVWGGLWQFWGVGVWLLHLWTPLMQTSSQLPDMEQ